MRVLSFFPAFLLAAASFVAAAPTANPVDKSCDVAPSGNDAPLQPVIAIIAGVTADVQVLALELSNLKGDSSKCTPDAVSEVVVKITTTVNACVSQLQAAAKVDLHDLDLGKLCITISGLLKVVIDIVGDVVVIVGILGASAVIGLQATLSALIKVVLSLVACLNVYVDASVVLSAAVGAVITVVINVAQLCLSVIIGVSGKVSA